MKRISDHVWRPMNDGRKWPDSFELRSQRPCEFMNCRRYRGEHVRVVKRFTP